MLSTPTASVDVVDVADVADVADVDVMRREGEDGWRQRDGRTGGGRERRWPAAAGGGDR